MALSLHFKIFLQTLRDVNETQASKYTITLYAFCIQLQNDYLNHEVEARRVQLAVLCQANPFPYRYPQFEHGSRYSKSSGVTYFGLCLCLVKTLNIGVRNCRCLAAFVQFLCPFK